eukprot:490290-Prymnesium_polylepis.1
MTSESDSMQGGFASTSVKHERAVCSDHRLSRRSSADRNDSPSELSARELMWYACAPPKVRFALAVTTRSRASMVGSRKLAAPSGKSAALLPAAGGSGLVDVLPPPAS